MHQAIQALFESSAKLATDDDIAHCPVDPGYHGYVAAMTAIRNTKQIPQESNFDITETIALTGWVSDPELTSDDSFKRFRRFVNSIGLGLEYQNTLLGHAFGHVRDVYHLAYLLLADLDESDADYIELLIAAFQAVRDACAANLFDIIDESSTVPGDEFEYQYVDESWIYFAFGMIYLSQLSDDWSSSETYATQMIDGLREGEYPEESDIGGVLHSMLRGEEPDKEFPSLFRNWSELFQRLTNPTNHGDTHTIVNALSQYSPTHLSN